MLWAGDSLAQLLPTLGILLGITATAMTIAIWRFNRGKIFLVTAQAPRSDLRSSAISPMIPPRGSGI